MWRYDRRDQHDFRWRDDVLVLGLHVGADDTPADPAGREALRGFLLQLGDVLQPDFLALDVYDDFADRKGKDLTREVFATNVYGPALVAAIGEPRLRSAPAAKVEGRPWGAVVVRTTDGLSAGTDPQARERVRASVWPA